MAAEPERLSSNCPSCGASLAFDPASGKLRCAGCKRLFEAHDGARDDVCEYDLLHCLKQGDKLNEGNETLEMTCESCGGKTRLPTNVLSGFCAFCKTPLVASSYSRRSIRPHGMVPFAVTREAAAAQFAKWLKERWFLPSRMRRVGLSEPLGGVYHPLWTFDFSVRTEYEGRRGDYYYVTRTREVNGKTETYRERKTRWTWVSGTVHLSFDDLMVSATSRLPSSVESELRPWGIAQAVNYEKELVRGFTEVSYDVPLREGLGSAQLEAQPQIREAVRRDIGGDTQEVRTMSTSYYNLSYKLLLVPCWQSVYRYGKKDYAFRVNGRTGEAHGERPWSVVKLSAFILSLVALVAAIGWLFLSDSGQALVRQFL